MSTLISPVVVAYDWTSGGRRALAWGLREGACRHRPVRVVHVIDPSDPAAPDRTTARRMLGRVIAEATDSGRANVSVVGEVLQGDLAEHLCRESRAAELLVVGPGAARRFTEPVWMRVWAEAACPVALVRGPTHVPDRRPVLVAVDGSTPTHTRTSDEAYHEALLHDVGLFAVTPEPGAGWHAQLVVTDLPREGDGEPRPRSEDLRRVLASTPECPLLLVPTSTAN